MSATTEETYSGVMFEAPSVWFETFWYPAELFSLKEVAELHSIKQSEVIQRKGFYKRWTMPGYLDCGDWEPIYPDKELTPKSKFYTRPEDGNA